MLILDEPTNYLDRDSLAALAGAIKEFDGGVVMMLTSTFVIWKIHKGSKNRFAFTLMLLTELLGLSYIG